MTTDDGDDGILEAFDELKQAIDRFWTELSKPFEAILKRLDPIVRRFQ